MMGVKTRNMQSCLQKHNKLNKLHLVGQLLNSLNINTYFGVTKCEDTDWAELPGDTGRGGGCDIPSGSMDAKCFFSI